eukprot:TRINITY_DN3559_c0_g1_i1.p1 TRINITY_DN3559_c0_g1~~TRINITY_DN3559_c0_g1_i1.p1  ORF type:complete len:327 (-),score=64.50 TRINITY_DN3559_c0_g1_i1:350-1330(-)
MEDVTQIERIRGSLLGLAWGDILGSPVEGWTENKISKIYGRYAELPKQYPYEKISRLLGRGKLPKRPLALHSDDTQLALALIHCCLSCGVKLKYWNLEKWVQILVSGMKSNSWRGYGRNFQRSIGLLTKGTKPEKTQVFSSGIGAAMRVGPLGSIFREDTERLMTVVWESSLTTHATIQAGALSVAVAASVAMLVKGIPLSEIWTKLPNVVAQQEKIWQEKHLDWLIDRTNYHSVSHALRTIFQDCDLYDVDSVREKIVEMAKETMKPGSKVHVNKGYCLLGGIHGIVSALLPDIDPKETLAEIVRLGYDTDTVAAIAGNAFRMLF